MRIPPRPQREPLIPPGGVEHHVRDMTATFAADVTLAHAQEQLAQHGQWLPIDGEPSAPLGRLVESNSTGPLRLGYGAWRDLLLGCQFTNGHGELVTAGGRTVKNVAGYDLTKFMVGQHGIFGRIVTLTTRTYRRPEAALLATFEPDVRRLSMLLTTPARPQWSVLRRDALLCGYLGDARTVAFYESDLPRHKPVRVERRTVEQDVEHRREQWTRQRGMGGSPMHPAAKQHDGANIAGAIAHGRDAHATFTFRAAVPPASVARFAEQSQIADWSADAAFGVVVGSCDALQRSAVERAATDVGGSVLFFDPAGKPLRLTSDPHVQRLIERLKVVFDDRGALQPIPVGMP
jgi:FAD/FMN-containing dehydrogenase